MKAEFVVDVPFNSLTLASSIDLFPPPLVFLDHRNPGPQFNAESCSFADHDDNANSAFSFHKLITGLRSL